MQSLKNNLEKIQEKIALAASKAGKSGDDITLVAVTKTFPSTVINQAIDIGIEHIGENRIQEALDKLPHIKKGAKRHFIGHLQRNKVKHAIKLFDMIQSVDSMALAKAINKQCSQIGLRLPVLVEVNTSGEISKFGCQPQEVLALLKEMDSLSSIEIKGLMTIAVYTENEELVRSCFKRLKGIFDEAQTIKLKNGNISTLSMGMSSDFEIAIEEGSTMVRIGSAIFGPRSAYGGKI